MAMHRAFERSYLLRVDPVETGDGVTLPFTRDGRIEVVDGQTLRLVASFYAQSLLPHARFTLSCTTDETSLRTNPDKVRDVRPNTTLRVSRCRSSRSLANSHRISQSG